VILIGVIVASCGKLPSVLVETVESVLGKQEAIEAVCMMPKQNKQDIISNIKSALAKLQHVDGVLILVGMYGESCCNFALSLISKDDLRPLDLTLSRPVRIVTGVNLPMLFKVCTYRNKFSLEELASLACEGGKIGILDATKRYYKHDSKTDRGD